VPSGWALATLNDVVADDGVFTDGDWVETKDQDPDGQVRLTQLADIGEGYFRDRSRRFLRDDQAAALNCTFLQPGDVLVARMPDPLGRACVLPDLRQPAVTAVDVCIVRPGSGSVDSRWLMWAINAPQFRARVLELQSGTTRRRISRKNLGTIEFPVPPLSEQRRIVIAIEEQLSRLDAAEASLAAARRRLEVMPAASLTHALASVSNTVRLADVAEVRLGRQRSPKNHSGPNMRPYLRAANVTWSGLNLSDVKSMNFSPSEAETYALRVGDVLLSEASGSADEVGKPAVWRGEIDGCCFQNTLIRVRSHGPNPDYLHKVFLRDALTGKFGEAAPGVGIRHLGSSRLSEWLVPVPTRDEQQRIVTELEAQLSRIEALRTSTDRAQRRSRVLRSTILERAFSGDLVPHDPADEPGEVLLGRIRAGRRAGGQTARRRKVNP
jgi:type I restriction enzyme, S subunit